MFSDGAYEIERPDGTTAQLADFIQQFGLPAQPGQTKLDELVTWAELTGGQSAFKDDLSLMEIELLPAAESSAP